MNSVALFLPTLLLAQQAPSVSGFRLGYTRRVYIENLGASEEAQIVRSQLSGAILSRTKLTLSNDRRDADAILIGNATIIAGNRQGVVGYSSTESAAAAAASGDSAVAAAASASRSRVVASAGTVLITAMGLQLLDRDDHIIWAFDGTRCSDTSSLLLLGVSRTKPVTTCAAEQLANAIDRDLKASRHGR